MALSKKLWKLQEWLTLEDTAAELTIKLNEEVNVARVLRLALDGALILSVNFVNGAYARRGIYLKKKHFLLDWPEVRSDLQDIEDTPIIVPLNQRTTQILIETHKMVSTEETPVWRYSSKVVPIYGVY